MTLVYKLGLLQYHCISQDEQKLMQTIYTHYCCVKSSTVLLTIVYFLWFQTSHFSWCFLKSWGRCLFKVDKGNTNRPAAVCYVKYDRNTQEKHKFFPISNPTKFSPISFSSEKIVCLQQRFLSIFSLNCSPDCMWLIPYAAVFSSECKKAPVLQW